MKIVLDTNCLLPAVFPRSKYHWIGESFRRGDFILCYSNEIVEEYEELLSVLYPIEITNSLNDKITFSCEPVYRNRLHSVRTNWQFACSSPDGRCDSRGCPIRK